MEKSYFELNPDAKILETAGLDASLKDGNHLGAHVLYGEALALVPTDDSVDTAAQRGSILRNDGFAYTRQAIASGDTELFTTADARLRTALAETAMFVSGLNVPVFKKLGPHNTFKKARRELFSEHAATLGLLARTATAAEVVVDSTEQTKQTRTNYGFAHDFARLGTNGYFRVSNAMNGARDERRQGNSRLPHTAVWVARAGFGLLWSAKNDRVHLLDAAKTFIRRMPDVLTPGRASRSVRVRP